MFLNDSILHINYCEDISRVEELLTRATPSYTLWGERVFCVEGYEGSTLIDEVAERVRRAAHGLIEELHMTEKNRELFVEVVTHLNRLYEESDRLIEEAPLPLRVLAYIQECCDVITKNFYSERYWVETVSWYALIQVSPLDEYFEAAAGVPNR